MRLLSGMQPLVLVDIVVNFSLDNFSFIITISYKNIA